MLLTSTPPKFSLTIIISHARRCSKKDWLPGRNGKVQDMSMVRMVKRIEGGHLRVKLTTTYASLAAHEVPAGRPEACGKSQGGQ